MLRITTVAIAIVVLAMGLNSGGIIPDARGEDAASQSERIRAARVDSLKSGKFSIETIEDMLNQPAAGSGFKTRPRVELQDDGRNVIVLEEFQYSDLRLHRWVVPKGYLTNGASVPRGGVHPALDLPTMKMAIGTWARKCWMIAP